MCSCPPAALIDHRWGLATCRICGIARTAPIQNIVRYCPPCSNRAPYSRRKRFLRLLSNTYASRVSKVHTDLLKALMHHEPKQIQDIYQFIRTSKNAHFKRYDALGFLAWHLLGQRVEPLSPNQGKWADFVFRRVETRHVQVRGTFPAYSWIIEQVLTSLNRTDLLPYVHQLKCKRRRHVYMKTYGSLFTIPSGASIVARPAN